VSLLVPPQDLVRYGGLDQAAPALSQLLCPAIAALVMARYGLSGTFFIEFATFVLALAITAAATVPSPPVSKEGSVGRGKVLHETAAAWGYIRSRPGLIGLLLLLANGHLSSGMVRKSSTSYSCLLCVCSKV
jgi:MFS transporter, DHA3 family, macrolide efflux protein